MTTGTPFPVYPAHVVPLRADEFMFDTAVLVVPTLDAVCGRFVDDPNRALVWLIRFEALRALRERTDLIDWFADGGRTPRDVCAIAARCELNALWQFDAEQFCSAVDAAISERSNRHA